MKSTNQPPLKMSTFDSLKARLAPLLRGPLYQNRYKVTLCHREVTPAGEGGEISCLMNLYCAGFELKQIAGKTVFSLYDNRQALSCEFFVVSNCLFSAKVLSTSSPQMPHGSICAYEIQIDSTTIKIIMLEPEGDADANSVD